MIERIAVLLTVYNRRNGTLKCLKNLYANTIPVGFAFDVYMTDDGCTDGTPEAVSKLFPDVKIIQGDGTLFWNRGMWLAWHEAEKKDYDYYLWLNDDTNLHSNAIYELLRESQMHNGKCIVVVACQSADHSEMTYGGWDKNGLVYPDGISKEVKTVNGNILLVPRYVFKILGNLDYHFHHGGGDFDYSWRAGEAGLKCFQAPMFLGECEPHHDLPSWCDPNVPILKRWAALYKPNGMPPGIIFYQVKRERGVLAACYRYILVHIKCLIPSIWVWRDRLFF